MQLLINTATELAEIIVYNPDNKELRYRFSGDKQNSIDFLLPTIEELVDYKRLISVTVVIGPGSFTALRMATSLANTLAQELQLPLFTINTAEYLAIRLQQPTSQVLLKAGGQLIHVYNPDNKSFQQQKITEYKFNDQQTYIADFTEKLRQLTETTAKMAWSTDMTAPTTEQLEQLAQTATKAQWPIEPQYHKGPGIHGA